MGQDPDRFVRTHPDYGAFGVGRAVSSEHSRNQMHAVDGHNHLMPGTYRSVMESTNFEYSSTT